MLLDVTIQQQQPASDCSSSASGDHTDNNHDHTNDPGRLKFTLIDYFGGHKDLQDKILCCPFPDSSPQEVWEAVFGCSDPRNRQIARAVHLYDILEEKYGAKFIWWAG
jgi:hypothetical protein